MRTGSCWLNCRKLGLGNDPADVFLDRGKVALTSLITEVVRRMAAAVSG